jgi:uncharacterized membrane protein YfcA
VTAFALPLLIGFGTGILSAWGVGGGTLLLLLMTLFLGVDPAAARCINLLYFLPTAGMGLIWHRKNGLLDREVCRQAVPWGLLAAGIAAWISSGLDPAILRRPFGVYLLLAGCSTLFQRQK